MDNYLNRIHHFKGNPREIGFAAGRALGPKLEQAISHYIANLESSSSTLHRFQRMASLIQALAISQTPANLPADLIRILADDEIERRERKLVTAYANVACPYTGEIWYTFGGYPAASKGNWQRMAWPWMD